MLFYNVKETVEQHWKLRFCSNDEATIVLVLVAGRRPKYQLRTCGRTAVPFRFQNFHSCGSDENIRANSTGFLVDN